MIVTVGMDGNPSTAGPSNPCELVVLFMVHDPMDCVHDLISFPCNVLRSVALISWPLP